MKICKSSAFEEFHSKISLFIIKQCRSFLKCFPFSTLIDNQRYDRNFVHFRYYFICISPSTENQKTIDLISIFDRYLMKFSQSIVSISWTIRNLKRSFLSVLLCLFTLILFLQYLISISTGSLIQ